MGQIGRWALVETIGEGGNAFVWEARSGDESAAIKILKDEPSTETRERFRRELKTMRQLESSSGVLPVLDSGDLDDPEGQWFAMPIARRIDLAIDRQSLADVVRAIAEIAEILGALAEIGVHHRDIKPANLFVWEGRAVVGDLGLVTDSEDERTLTGDERWVGAVHFMAPEMLRGSEVDDAGPADVYSLAKTLWVLANPGHRWPPPGTHRFNQAAFCLYTHIEHPRASEIDLLIERGTSHEPKERPTMTDFGEELRVWLDHDKPRPPTHLPDLRQYKGPLNKASELAVRKEVDDGENATLLEVALDQFVDHMAPVSAAMAAADINGLELARNSPGFNLPDDLSRLEVGRATKLELASYSLRQPPTLTMLFGLVLRADRTVTVFSTTYLAGASHPEPMTLHISDDVPLGSPQMATEMTNAAQDVVDGLDRAFRTYVDSLP